MASKTGEDLIVRLLPTLLVTASLAITASQAADTVLASERLFVGKTNIFCLQAPCPWRGIARADDQPAGPSNLLWSEQKLPPLNASPQDAQRIVDAWNSDRCLSIEGQMLGSTLQVERIVGACR